MQIMRVGNGGPYIAFQGKINRTSIIMIDLESLRNCVRNGIDFVKNRRMLLMLKSLHHGTNT